MADEQSLKLRINAVTPLSSVEPLPEKLTLNEAFPSKIRVKSGSVEVAPS
ncbi:hypothetical protein N9Y48_00285 [Zobellia sp.]|nr:hypothetical protein [Zobellia sp.]